MRRAAAQRQQQQQQDWGRRGGAAHLVSAIDSLTRRYQDQSFEEGEEDEDEFDDAEALDCTARVEGSGFLLEEADSTESDVYLIYRLKAGESRKDKMHALLPRVTALGLELEA